MTKNMLDTFTCVKCDSTYEKNLPDSVVDAEAELLFGIKNATVKAETGKKAAFMCDDCFKAVYVLG